MSESSSNPSSPTASSTFRAELAFPTILESMLDRMRPYGVEVSLPAGTQLFSRGQREADMFVMISGAATASIMAEAGERKVIGVMRDRQFTGELDLISTQPSLVDACTTSECKVLRIDRPSLKRLMRSEGDIANLIMQAAVWRRVGLIEQDGAGIVLLGEATASETVHLRRFLVRNGYPHRLLEPGPEQLTVFNAENPTSEESGFPAIVFSDGRVLYRPTIDLLADQLGVNEALDASNVNDIVVVGAGPAGLAAAVYGASEGLSTLVIEGMAPGGQAGTSSKIENYLGFPTGVSGWELANRAQVQAQKFGARIAIARDVVSLDRADGLHRVHLKGGATVRSRTVVIASGARYRKLDIPNYTRFENQGIHYAATAMEAALCRGHEVVVVGGGNSAGQAAVYLSGTVEHVHLIIRGESLAATMSQYLVSRIENSQAITLHKQTTLERFDGGDTLEFVTWKDRKTGELEEHKVGSVFVMIGAEPNTGWLYGAVSLDKRGFVLTGGADAFETSRYATNVPGVYAIGDVRADSVKRVASAVGEGSVVISDIHRYLAGHAEA